MVLSNLVRAFSRGIRNRCGYTPEVPEGLDDAELGSRLLQASKDGDVGMVKQLIRQGARIEFMGFGGATALLCASAMGSVRVAKYLISKGANIEASIDRGMTPLLLAIESGIFPMVELLLRSGADTESVNDVGRTPLSLSYIYMRTDMTGALLTHGASLETSDFYGFPPSHYADHIGTDDFFSIRYTSFSYDLSTRPVVKRVVPTETVSVDADVSHGVGSECSICMSVMSKCQSRSYLECGHVFHTDCLKGWMRVKNTCPMDRLPFSEYTKVDIGTHE